MLKKTEHEDEERKRLLYHKGKKLYEKPQVKEYGSIERLTQGATGPQPDGMGQLRQH